MKFNNYCPTYDQVMKLSQQPSVSFGPIVLFDRIQNDRWYGSIMRTEDKKLQFDPKWKVERLMVDIHHGIEIETTYVSIPLKKESSLVSYTCNESTYNIRLVGTSEKDVNIAFSSCNSLSCETGATKNQIDKMNPIGLWKDLQRKNAAVGFHYMVQMGDFLYNDMIVNHIPEYIEWLDNADKLQEITWDLVERISKLVFFHYVFQFQNPYIQGCMATIPSIMLVDDHDVLNGWGSLQRKWRQSEGWDVLYRISFEYIQLFQYHYRVQEPIRVIGNNITLLCPRTREYRTHSQIILNQERDLIIQRMNDAKENEHLILATGTPLIYPDLYPINEVLDFISIFTNWIFGKEQEEQLDVNDAWYDSHHKWERDLILDSAFGSKAKLTLVSGDVHMSNCSIIDNDKGHKVVQLISTGIQTQPPPLPVSMWYNFKNYFFRKRYQKLVGNLIPRRNYGYICFNDTTRNVYQCLEDAISWSVKENTFECID